MDTTTKNFASRLTAVLESRDVTPLELLARLDRMGQGVTLVTLGRWLAGKNAPQLANLQAIATALNVPVSALADPVAN